MIKAKREIDLLSYLPPFLREYDETKAALNAENPEFELLWKYAGQVLDSSFIDRADEYGIRRFEKLLGILPDADSDLETRRSEVKVKWLSKLPYTYRMLLKRLYELCGENFSVSKSFETDYTLIVLTHIGNWIKALEIKRLIIKMIPANIRTDYYNSVQIKTKKPEVYCGAVTSGKKKSIYCRAKNTF